MLASEIPTTVSDDVVLTETFRRWNQITVLRIGLIVVAARLAILFVQRSR